MTAWSCQASCGTGMVNITQECLLLKSLISIFCELHVQSCDSMVQGHPPLNVPVLCEGIDGVVWPIVTQQSWHIPLHPTCCVCMYATRVWSWQHAEIRDHPGSMLRSEITCTDVSYNRCTAVMISLHLVESGHHAKTRHMLCNMLIPCICCVAC